MATVPLKVTWNAKGVEGARSREQRKHLEKHGKGGEVMQPVAAARRDADGRQR